MKILEWGKYSRKFRKNVMELVYLIDFKYLKYVLTA